MHAFLTIEMDRPVTEDHYIVPGGFAVETTDGSAQEFDFCRFEVCGKACNAVEFPIEHMDSANRPDVRCFKLTSPDYDSFPDMKNLLYRLADAKSLKDCFIFTGEPGEDREINVRSLIGFEIVFEPGDERLAVDTNNGCVEIKAYPDRTIAAFTESAIADYNRTLPRDR